jgi:DNA-binding transcriptional ArsR family regulator
MARATTTSDAFNAIAEPRRREILVLLRGGEQPVTGLARDLEMTQPQASKHLRVTLQRPPQEPAGRAHAVAALVLALAALAGRGKPVRRVVPRGPDPGRRGGPPPLLPQGRAGDAELTGSALQLTSLRLSHHATIPP